MSDFTPEEVDRLANGGNAKCNALYMARFPDGVDARPVPANREDKLRDFIRKKYVDRLWYAETPVPVSVTVAPQEAAGAPAAAFDAFGAGGASAGAQPPPSQAFASFDAFGAPAVQQSAFAADFGAAPQPAAEQSAFATDFGAAAPQAADAFGGFGSPAATVAAPPANGFAGFPSAPAAPQPQVATFDAFGAGAQPVQQQPVQQQPVPQQQAGFAAFGAPQQPVNAFAPAPAAPAAFAAFGNAGVPQPQAVDAFGNVAFGATATPMPTLTATPTLTPQVAGQGQAAAPAAPAGGDAFSALDDLYEEEKQLQQQAQQQRELLEQRTRGPSASGAGAAQGDNPFNAPTANGAAEHSPAAGGAAPAAYAVGDQVVHTSSEGVQTRGTVIKVHYDDNPPYYSVKLTNGKEKNTDHTCLTKFVPGMQLQAPSAAAPAGPDPFSALGAAGWQGVGATAPPPRTSGVAQGGAFPQAQQQMPVAAPQNAAVSNPFDVGPAAAAAPSQAAVGGAGTNPFDLF